MAASRVEVVVVEEVNRPGSDRWRDVVTRSTRLTLEAEGAADAQISLTLFDDGGMEALNREWLGHAGTTDVIAFPLHDEAEPPVGDVYIGLEQAARQAEELGVPLEEELARLAVHGTLHVLGWGHPEGEDRQVSAMWTRQEEILRRILAGGPRGA